MPREIRPVRELPPEVARKIAAGEVIDRPAAAVRELLDNAIDSNASKISLEITGGGIDRIRVTDNGSGMSADDLAICAHTHTTSKISAEDDLLTLTTLGFRGEALSSIQAVSNLEITTTRDGREAWRLRSGTIEPARLAVGTTVQVDSLFANFPARRQFLKRPSAETALCRQIFIEKALAWPEIEFRMTVDGAQRAILPPSDTLRERCLSALEPKESETFFHEIAGAGPGFSFRAVLGSPDVTRSDRRDLMVFVNGRRIMEYALLQAMEYGAEGHFPNGTHPMGCLFVTIEPHLVDFNIHPAKREARFRDPGSLHHAMSSTVRDFYRRYTIASLARESAGADMLASEPSLYERDDLGNATAHPGPARSYDGIGAYSKAVERGTDARSACFAMRGDSGAYLDSSVPSRRQDYSQASDRASFRYLGQVLGTFLAVEREGTFYLIDQHAAHERILFNEFLSGRGKTQELLVPYRIETDSEERDRVLHERQQALAESGFSVENEGDGIWQVTAVPASWTGTQKDLARDLLESSINPDTLASHLYATAACRAACKDGDVLDEDTARDLAEKTFALPEPVCPHGRPVWIAMNREELFARIRRT